MPERILNETTSTAAAPSQSTQPALAPLIEDALESHDRWRTLWRTFTNDWALLVVLLGIGLLLAAWLLLPQSPTNGPNDPTAYSQWQAAARTQTGPAFVTLDNLGLFRVFGTPWMRLLTLIALSLTLLRLAERAINLLRPSVADGHLRDETRLRITDTAPTLAALRQRLQATGSRVFDTSDTWLAADRAPLADALTLLLHLGLAIGLLGLLVNCLVGWNNPHTIVNPGAISRLGGHVPVQLISAEPETGSVQLSIDGVPGRYIVGTAQNRLGRLIVTAEDFVPVLRVSGQTTDRRPLQLATSNYAPASTEAIIAFRGGDSERSIAIPSENLIMIFSPENGGTYHSYALSTGRQIGRGPISTTVALTGATLNISREFGAIVRASSYPGNPMVIGGLLLSLLGGLGARLRPTQRLLIRKTSGSWTEFYGSGQGARAWVKSLLE